MNEYGFLSIIPMIIVLIIAFYKRNVFLALATGLITSSVIVGTVTGNYLSGITAIANVFTSSGTAATTFFVLLMGGIMTAASRSGGFEGLVRYATERKRIITTRRRAEMLPSVLGLLLFADGTSSITVTSMSGKPFFHKFGIPKERLAFIANSTGSAVAWFVPFGSAAAVFVSFLTPVMTDLGISDNPFSIVLRAVPFQFFAIALMIVLFTTVITGKDIGPKKRTDTESDEDSIVDVYEKDIPADKKPLARNMIIPLLFLVASIFTLLLISGNGNIADGDGSSSVFSAGVLTLLFAGILYRVQGLCTIDKYISWCIDGMTGMFPLTMILVLAYSFSSMLSILGTASYIASFTAYLPGAFLLPASLLAAAVISYATGTSGGTVSLLIPIMIPVAYASDIPLEYMIGVIISGAVFGDQSSPISDSVILSSSMTGTKIIDHVRTELPYTLIALFMALIAFTILGFTI